MEDARYLSRYGSLTPRSRGQLCSLSGNVVLFSSVWSWAKANGPQRFFHECPAFLVASQAVFHSFAR
eukprot:7794164-Lingulodinium_polyedra.AAC.1